MAKPILTRRLPVVMTAEEVAVVLDWTLQETSLQSPAIDRRVVERAIYFLRGGK